MRNDKKKMEVKRKRERKRNL